MVISLISGVNKYIADRVANLGSNVFLLTRFPLITDVEELVKAERRNKKVTWEDYRALRDNMKLPLRLGVEQRTGARVRVGAQGLEDTSIRGVTANMVDINTETVRDGRYITEGDDQSRAAVAMIGNDLAAEAFDREFPGRIFRYVKKGKGKGKRGKAKGDGLGQGRSGLGSGRTSRGSLSACRGRPGVVPPGRVGQRPSLGSRDPRRRKRFRPGRRIFLSRHQQRSRWPVRKDRRHARTRNHLRHCNRPDRACAIENQTQPVEESRLKEVPSKFS